MEICKGCVPRTLEVEPGHTVVCHLYDSQAVELNKRMEEEGVTFDGYKAAHVDDIDMNEIINERQINNIKYKKMGTGL